MKNKKISVAIMGIVILWTLLIFYFSSQPPDVSNYQSRTVAKWYTAFSERMDITNTEFYIKAESFVFEKMFDGKYISPNARIRKSAHFGIYFVLGLFSATFAFFHTKKYLMVLIVGICLPTTIAVLDEFNQGFNNRTASLGDVIIDGVGATVATFLVLLSLLLYHFVSKGIQKMKKRRT